MILRERILDVLENYQESDIKVATICSHSSLQIFHGARMEGFATLGIVLPRNRPYYESFPRARPDIILEVESYGDILSDDFQRKLIEENAIIIPHGSFVEYIGAKNILERFYVPMFGNRLTLFWEGDRRKQRLWFQEAGVAVPKIFNDPSSIDRPSIVKLHGAKGGYGYFNVSSPEEFHKKFGELEMKGLVNEITEVVIEELVPGVRYYPHFFISSLGRPNLPDLTYGSLELLGIDRRLEVIDEVYRGLPKIIEDYLDYTVTGNLPVVVREKFVVDLLENAAKVASASRKLFNPGLIGPFCLEMIYHPKRGFVVFEVSARIVAGTNLYSLGSPYSTYYYPEPMSMGRRIARELKVAIKEDKLRELIY